MQCVSHGVPVTGFTQSCTAGHQPLANSETAVAASLPSFPFRKQTVHVVALFSHKDSSCGLGMGGVWSTEDSQKGPNFRQSASVSALASRLRCLDLHPCSSTSHNPIIQIGSMATAVNGNSHGSPAPPQREPSFARLMTADVQMMMPTRRVIVIIIVWPFLCWSSFLSDSPQSNEMN